MRRALFLHHNQWLLVINIVFVVSGKIGGPNKVQNVAADEEAAGKDCKCNLIYIVVVVVAMVIVIGSICFLFYLRTKNTKKKHGMDNQANSS